MERFDSMARGLLLVLLIAGVQASCGQGQFGESCRYSCNCQVECDQDTGACPGNCSAGWVKGGQLCQKHNIAFEKEAWTYRPDNYLYKHWPATNAVDGDNNIRGDDGTCFQGEPGSNYLTIDLGKKFKLYHIRLYLRHKFEWRISGAEISDYDNHSIICYTFPSSISNNPTDVVCNMVARSVMITNTDTPLSICEVEIYQCSPGTYGKDCNYFCHCSDCDVRTGVCTGGCFAGWQGGRCDLECSPGTYGENCTDFCHCSGCDVRTGVCNGDCFEGWQGDMCDRECSPGTYGKNCTNLCHCSDCDVRTGVCTGHCFEGWQGDRCDICVSDAADTSTIDIRIIALSTTVGVLVVIIVILTVVIIRVKRRQRSSSKTSEGDNRTVPGPNPIQDHIYTEMTSTDTNRSSTPANYERFQFTEDNQYTGLQGQTPYENI